MKKIGISVVLLLALPLLLVTSRTTAQSFGPDHLTVSPASPAPNSSFGILAPVTVCWHTDPTAVIVNSTVLVNGNTLTLTVNSNWSGGCFSAGDPAVKKSVTFAGPPLAGGTYTLRYLRYNYSTQTDDESITFSVADDASSVPTLSHVTLAGVVLLMLGVASMFLRKRRLP